MTVRSLRNPLAIAGVVALLVGACSGSATPVPPIAAPSGAAAPSAAVAASPSAAPSAPPTIGPSPAASTAASPGAGTTGCPTSAPAPMAAADTATVTLATAKGDIVIKVTGSLAPQATGNLVALAACGFYDGVVFHRLVPGFVIQGGDGQYGRAPNVDTAHVGGGGPGYTIADDPVTTPYKRGTVAMARTSQPNSQGSQFFIVLSDGAAPALASANTYAIMGEVTSGMDVVDAIAAMPNSGEPANAALDPLPITKATVARP
jgi:peptidyl-prolyl cis-trans isomerase B (cyclophilin B)